MTTPVGPTSFSQVTVHQITKPNLFCIDPWTGHLHASGTATSGTATSYQWQIKHFSMPSKNLWNFVKKVLLAN